MAFALPKSFKFYQKYICSIHVFLHFAKFRSPSSWLVMGGAQKIIVTTKHRPSKKAMLREKERYSMCLRFERLLSAELGFVRLNFVFVHCQSLRNDNHGRRFVSGFKYLCRWWILTDRTLKWNREKQSPLFCSLSLASGLTTRATTQDWNLPFHLVRALRDKEALRVGEYLSTTWIDGDFAVRALLALDLDRQQQQFQLGEAQPGPGFGYGMKRWDTAGVGVEDHGFRQGCRENTVISDFGVWPIVIFVRGIGIGFF